MGKLFFEYIRENSKNIIMISSNQDADKMFEELESFVNTEKFICINKCLSGNVNSQVVEKFVNKYKEFVEFTYMYNDLSDSEKMYIKMRKTENKKNPEMGYTGLLNAYNEKYYLEDCGGYDTFTETNGEKLPDRLQEVYNLVNPQKDDIILDIGCGRGELSYMIHLSGAKTIAIDYSSEAINIANTTYKDIKKSNLEFICEDIFTMPNNQQFNKIVMADIVEHIEQPMLENLLVKVSQMLTHDGILIIHTAPNRDYYDFIYPEKVRQAREMGIFLPKNPRSYYEQLMHINEQTPSMLEKSLEQVYTTVQLWTGGLNEIFIQKDKERSKLDNSIFAIASHKEEVLKLHTYSYYLQPDDKKNAVKITPENLTMRAKAGSTIKQSLVVKNCGNEIINSYGKFSTNLSYHLMDIDGNTLLFDGIRTKLKNLLNPNMSTVTDIVISIPEFFNVGRYIIRITMVSEGSFWFDNLSADYYCDVYLDVI